VGLVAFLKVSKHTLLLAHIVLLSLRGLQAFRLWSLAVAAAALMRTGLEAGINQQEVAEALPIKTA
jgi:hypothetical protein